MGNAGGSMFWMFGIVIVIYIVGMSLYQLYLWIKKSGQEEVINHEYS